MKAEHELKNVFSKSLNWHGSRLELLVKMVMALIQVRTVNLVKIAVAFSGRSQINSNYRRLQRFFQKFSLNYDEIARFLIKFLPSKEWVIILDRTTWHFGKKKINILMLAIAPKGIAFPILWTLLPKGGNSHTSERIALMERFINLFGKDKIACVTADREFIGRDWFEYLIKQNIRLCIRLKNNTKVGNARGQLVNAWTLFNHLSVGESLILPGKRSIWGEKLHLVGMKLKAGEFLIIATTDSPEMAFAYYGKRWQIETLFGCLKSRGFNFESTHLTEDARISSMIAILAITFVWAHKIGEWLHQQWPIPLKKTIGRPAKSIFRYGLDTLQNLLCNLNEKFQEFQQFVKLLSCT